MYSAREQYETINKVVVKDGDTKRIDCPFCGSKKTLTISRLEGALVWNCYEASCTASGSKRVGYGLDTIKHKFNKGPAPSINKRAHPIPEVNSCINNHEHVLKYIKDNNCVNAVDEGAIKITYDPAKDRALFWMNGNTGAVGRTLKRGVTPKWLSYGDTQGVLAVGDRDIAIVVEDAASACAVYATGKYTGVSLLGTNVSPLQRTQLNRYSKLIICLDKDASKKAISIYRGLSAYVDTQVCFITEDLKYMRPANILETIDARGALNVKENNP